MQILTFAYDEMHEGYVGMCNMPYYQKKMCTGHKSGKRTVKGHLCTLQKQLKIQMKVCAPFF